MRRIDGMVIVFAVRFDRPELEESFKDTVDEMAETIVQKVITPWLVDCIGRLEIARRCDEAKERLGVHAYDGISIEVNIGPIYPEGERKSFDASLN